MLGELSIEEFVMGEDNFRLKGAQDFLALLKKKTMKKINMKKFFQLEARSSIKT